MNRSGNERIDALDGLRGIAIILVLLHHFNLASHRTTVDTVVSEVAACGWAGVDLFFVLSGFLITGILWRTRSTKNYFRNFYARRTLRIFPLYYAFVGVMLIAFGIISRSYPEQTSTTLAHQGWVWTYTTNILLAIKGDWTQAVPSLNHFWSLAVEEQFYLFWPAVIWFVATERHLIRLCYSLVGLAIVFRVLCWSTGNPLGAYVLTPARMDALAVGALVYLLSRSADAAARMNRFARPVALSCAFAVAILVVTQGPSPEARVVSIAGSSVLALLFGAIVVLVLSDASPLLTRVCGSRVLRATGMYSYAMYVLHPSVRRVLMDVVMPRVAIPTLWNSDLPRQAIVYAAGISITFIIAAVSWHLFESHILKLKSRFPYAESAA